MIINNLPQFQRQPMLIDRAIITTRFPVNPEVIANRVGFNEKFGTDIVDIDPGSRQRDGKDQKTHKIVFGSYGGIVVFAEQEESGLWYAHTIHFNPRNLLFRHNGHDLSVDEFLKALTILREEVAFILAHQDDIIHIVPGLHRDSRAYWSLLEIPIDLADPDGELEEKVFRNPHFPKMREGFRHRNGTVQIGATDGPFQIKFYRKDKQMRKLLRKCKIKDAPRIFRVEVVLSCEKLLEHLGDDGNLGIVDGSPRLVRFSPSGLVDFHRRIMMQLKGCFRMAESTTSKKNGKDKLGRYIAIVATTYDIPVVDLAELCEVNIGISKRTKGRLLTAAREELARMSPSTLEEVFSYANYQHQPAIAIPDVEAAVDSYRLQITSDGDIEAAYGSPLPFPRNSQSA